MIDQVIGRLIAHPEATSLRSAHAMAEPPEEMFRLAGKYFAGLFPDDPRPEYFHLPRQAFSASYHPNGSVDIVRTGYIWTAQNGSIYGERILAMTTPFTPEVDVPRKSPTSSSCCASPATRFAISLIANSPRRSERIAEGRSAAPVATAPLVKLGVACPSW